MALVDFGIQQNAFAKSLASTVLGVNLNRTRNFQLLMQQLIERVQAQRFAKKQEETAKRKKQQQQTVAAGAILLSAGLGAAGGAAGAAGAGGTAGAAGAGGLGVGAGVGGNFAASLGTGLGTGLATSAPVAGGGFASGLSSGLGSFGLQQGLGSLTNKTSGSTSPDFLNLGKNFNPQTIDELLSLILGGGGVTPVGGS